MRRTPILLLAGLSILLAVGNVLQWRDWPTDDEVIARFGEIWNERLKVYFGRSGSSSRTIRAAT